MQPTHSPIFKDVVLAGGGHAHALLIRRWGMQPIPGVRLTLVSPDPNTPYSGMLPGLIAGHYSFEDMHIDLVRLCHWAGVRFICSEVTGIETRAKQVLLKDRPALGFDVLSIDTGSTPDHDIPGVAENTIPIKPIAGFWQHWQRIRKNQVQTEKPENIAVVGGGAGSVEAILAMAWNCTHSADISVIPAFHLVTQAGMILPGYPAGVRKKAEAACRNLSVEIHTGFSVAKVAPSKLISAEDNELDCDAVFWCTQAGAPEWPTASGLACTEEGFIEVNEYLQSCSHEYLFAAGDIAHMIKSPRPKAGVYAVRQAPVLYENLRNYLLQIPLEVFKPQDRFLSLLSLGGKVAAGNRGRISASGNWVWTWKDHIDRKFMGRFLDLPEMAVSKESQVISAVLVPEEDRAENLDPNARCGGCGSKVGPEVLSCVLGSFNADWQAEDASIEQWNSPTLVQSIDQLKAPFDDPWLMGRISVFHALNDIHAMNARPRSIQVGITLPFAGKSVQQRELTLLMQGILSACQEEQVTLLGGHTSEGSEVTVAVIANGEAGETTYSKQGIRRGDILVTNKPLGSGIMLAGYMLGKTPGKHLAETLAVMNSSNSPYIKALGKADVSACTDISGFGLLGHLQEMLAGSEIIPQLDMDALHVQAGVADLLAAGIRSSLSPQNEAMAKNCSWISPIRNHKWWPVLHDPQTSGGLLAAVSKTDEGQLMESGFRKIGHFV